MFSEKPLTRARAKLINYKNAAKLALLMLDEEGGSEDSEIIDSMCDGHAHPVILKMTILHKIHPREILCKSATTAKNLRSFSSN
jgi:hypothetical protein